ncbi:hypothetical protein F4678DRAFT_465584 [Xylaria arbuscula]|nr:hypothetical protein F4678DRAFT_465584 [Xylaria arbuscula]
MRMLWRERSGSATPFSLRLNRLLSDTWLWEIVLVILSGLFFALIIVILKIYNRKEVPQFAYGITLNAIISILATFSKSSLLVAVAASISQFKWHWYRSSDGKRLFDMQLFDDASRGPLGAIQILARVSRWPFASVGAIVFVLVPAFDPFVQQVISYSTETVGSSSPLSQPSNTPRAENFIARHKANDPFADIDDLQQLVAASLWDFSSDQAGLPDNARFSEIRVSTVLECLGGPRCNDSFTKRGGLTQALPQVASRINKYIREKDGIAVPGQSFTLVVLVNIRWGWLSLPAATWVIGIGFFLATIRVCRDDKQMLWKGSSLPLFYHGLTNEDLKVIEAIANKRDKVSSMESASKKVHVRFPRDANPPQLRLARCTDGSSEVEGGDTCGPQAVDCMEDPSSHL